MIITTRAMGEVEVLRGKKQHMYRFKAYTDRDTRAILVITAKSITEAVREAETRLHDGRLKQR